MNLNIYNYLQDFEKMDLPNENGVFIEDNNVIQKIEEYDFHTNNSLFYYKLKNQFHGFAKLYRHYLKANSISNRLFSELLTSRMYEKNGINCVRTYPFKFFNNEWSTSRSLGTISEDLTKIQDINVSCDNEQLEKGCLSILHNDDISTKDFFNDEWSILTQPKMKEYLLSQMTEEGFEQLVDLIIADTLFFQWDRFGGSNLFFAKTPQSDKIEGVIPIDLESINFDDIDVFYDNSVDEFVDDQYNEYYYYCSPHGANTYISYKDRILDLKRLMDEGYFNSRQVKLIKDILNCNISEELEDLLNKYNLDCDKNVFKVYNKMWNRNGEMLKI